MMGRWANTPAALDSPSSLDQVANMTGLGRGELGGGNGARIVRCGFVFWIHAPLWGRHWDDGRRGRAGDFYVLFAEQGLESETHESPGLDWRRNLEVDEKQGNGAEKCGERW